jgi:hypothetical protein
VIPALNEARNLPYVFGRLPGDIHEVIVVDGHSVDGTAEVARALRPDVRVVKQTRTGKGNALACGFAAATGDVIAMIDADGSADPAEIPLFVKALLDGADFAKGTRFAWGGGGDITFLRGIANRALGLLVNACYGTHYSDLRYGFSVFWRRHTAALALDATSPVPPGGGQLRGDGQLWGDGQLRGDGPDAETLIHIRAAEAGLAVTEVPSFAPGRTHGESSLSAVRDGLRILRTIMAERRHGRQGRATLRRRHLDAHPGSRAGLPVPGVRFPAVPRRLPNTDSTILELDQ